VHSLQSGFEAKLFSSTLKKVYNYAGDTVVSSCRRIGSWEQCTYCMWHFLAN
jgi:hypothetical protein